MTAGRHEAEALDPQLIGRTEERELVFMAELEIIDSAPKGSKLVLI